MKVEVTKPCPDLVPLTDERARREKQNDRCENPLGNPEKVTTRYRQAPVGKSRRIAARPIQAQTSRVRKGGPLCPTVRRDRRGTADHRASWRATRDHRDEQVVPSSRAVSHRGGRPSQTRQPGPRKGGLRRR